MAAGLLLLTAAYPLWLAWQAVRGTTLTHAVCWAVAAWAAWLAAMLTGTVLGRYLGLCLTGCTAVAVLGARRPGVWAWEFVVLGLFAVLLLPVAEGLGNPRIDEFRALFLGATLAVGVLNYLPTRLWPAVVLLGLGGSAELAFLLTGGGDEEARLEWWGRWLLAVSPWAGMAQAWRAQPGRSEFDRVWLGFRNRFGLVWGQRAREQFNRAAAHARWPVVLRWGGLRLAAGVAPPRPETQAQMVATLQAILKRFGYD